MDYQLLQNIETIIINNLLAYRQLLLPDVCVLAINRYGASLTPDGNTLIPPQDNLEIYHPQSFCEVNLVELLAHELTNSDVSAAHELYWQYIAQAVPDGSTLTVNSLAIIDISMLEVLAISPEIQAQLNPETPQYIAPATSPVQQQRNNAPRQRQPQAAKKNHGAITLSTILLVVSALYVAYYFFARGNF